MTVYSYTLTATTTLTTGCLSDLLRYAGNYNSRGIEENSRIHDPEVSSVRSAAVTALHSRKAYIVKTRSRPYAFDKGCACNIRRRDSTCAFTALTRVTAQSACWLLVVIASCLFLPGSLPYDCFMEIILHCAVAFN